MRLLDVPFGLDLSRAKAQDILRDAASKLRQNAEACLAFRAKPPERPAWPEAFSATAEMRAMIANDEKRWPLDWDARMVEEADDLSGRAHALDFLRENMMACETLHLSGDAIDFFQDLREVARALFDPLQAGHGLMAPLSGAALNVAMRRARKAAAASPSCSGGCGGCPQHGSFFGQAAVEAMGKDLLGGDRIEGEMSGFVVEEPYAGPPQPVQFPGYRPYR